MDIKKRTLQATWQLIKTFVGRMDRHHITSRSAELAYYLMMSVLLMCVSLVYAAHFIPGVIELVDRHIISTLPEAIGRIARQALLSVRVPGSISVIIGTTFTVIWSSSRSFHALMHTFDVIYQVEGKKHPIKTKITSILFTVALVGVLVAIFFISVVEHALAGFLLHTLGVHLNDELNTILSIVIMLGLFLAVYCYVPNRRICFRCALPGTLFATAAWFLMARGFSYYVSRITTLSWVLGSLGSIFIFMIWVYWCSIVILMGAEFNAMLESKRLTKGYETGSSTSSVK